MKCETKAHSDQIRLRRCRAVRREGSHELNSYDCQHSPRRVKKSNFLSVQFVKTKLKRFQARLFCAVALGMGSSFSLASGAEDWADTACLPVGMAPAKSCILWPACRGGTGRSQPGAEAGAEYKGV